MPETVRQADQEAGQAVPIETRCASPKVEGDRLIENVSMTETQEALVFWTNANATVCLGHVQDQGNKLLARRTEGQAAADVRQVWIGGLIRKRSVGGNPTDGTIDDQAGRTVR